MIRPLAALALACALTSPAAAEPVRIDVTGKSDIAVRREVRRAVEAVCRRADRESPFSGAYTVQNCLADSEARAMSQLREMRRRSSLQAQSDVSIMTASAR